MPLIYPILSFAYGREAFRILLRKPSRTTIGEPLLGCICKHTLVFVWNELGIVFEQSDSKEYADKASKVKTKMNNQTGEISICTQYNVFSSFSIAAACVLIYSF